jgi:serine/threonine protein kinase
MKHIGSPFHSVVNATRVGVQCDMFSLGMTMYEIASGQTSLPANGPQWHALRSLECIPILTAQLSAQNVTLELCEAITTLLSMNPDFRPRARTLLQQPFLASDAERELQRTKHENEALRAQLRDSSAMHVARARLRRVNTFT